MDNIINAYTTLPLNSEKFKEKYTEEYLIKLHNFKTHIQQIIQLSISQCFYIIYAF